MSDVKFLLRLW